MRTPPLILIVDDNPANVEILQMDWRMWSIKDKMESSIQCGYVFLLNINMRNLYRFKTTRQIHDFVVVVNSARIMPI